MKAFSEFRKKFVTNPPLCLHKHVLADRIDKQYWDDSVRFEGTCQECSKTVGGVLHNSDRRFAPKCTGSHLKIEFNGKFMCRRCPW